MHEEISGLEAETAAGTQVWLTVFSDMVTNLMLFFLILFAFTRLSVEVREDLFRKIQEHFGGLATLIAPREQPKQEKESIEEALKGMATVVEDEKMIKVILPSPVLFERGEAELKSECFPALNEIANLLKENNLPVVVEGHTCDIPIVGGRYKSNWELSSARAFSVIKFFVHRHNLSPRRFSIMGCAEHSPVAPNDSEENRAKNRRIEIVIKKK